MKSVFIIVLLAALFTSSCVVSQTRYDAAVTELNQLKIQMVTLEGEKASLLDRVSQLQIDLDGSEALVAEQDVEIASLKADLAEAQKALTTQKSQVTQLENRLSDANGELTDFRNLMCERTFNDVWNNYAVWGVKGNRAGELGAGDPGNFALGFAIFQTQYTPRGSTWQASAKATTLLDVYGVTGSEAVLILDVRNRCFYINPSFSPVGR